MLKQLFTFGQPSAELKFNIQKPETSQKIAANISNLVSDVQQSQKEIIVLCIGTDRSTGDALGPLTGSKLQSLQLYPFIYGTLEQPVHATNLEQTLLNIHETFANPFIIAVDACLGKLESVGCISLGLGPLKPGAAVNKKLPPVGDVYITGIVNVGGFMEHLVLQSTRLNLVIKMSEVIAYSLAQSLRDTAGQRIIQ
ncbi:MAG: sporulation protein YyaC [Firmicutes bacterium]|nr:sporulation protein YyaC [Bacillota bacterium]